MPDDTLTRRPRTILATCCVPWTAHHHVDEDAFRRSIRLLRAQGFRDLYVFGTAGEGHAVDEARFDEVVRIFLDEVPAADDPMVGVISLSLPTVVERIERCVDAGVRSFQISLPSWGALADAELRTFFAETCGRFPDAAFLHYNLPRAGRVVTPSEYVELAARHPNLVATKNAGAAYPTAVALLEEAGMLRHYFTEPAFAYASLHGDAALLVSVASLNGARARAFFDAGVRRDGVELGALGAELAALQRELAAVAGAAHMDGAFDKCFAKVHDPAFPLRLLPPYETISDESFERFASVVRERFPQWLPDAGAT